MRSPPHPRAAWPSSDDNTGFNLIVILLGYCVGAYLLWTCYHGAISAAVIALRHHEIALIRHFTDRYDLADRQLLAEFTAKQDFAKTFEDAVVARFVGVGGPTEQAPMAAAQ